MSWRLYIDYVKHSVNSCAAVYDVDASGQKSWRCGYCKCQDGQFLISVQCMAEPLNLCGNIKISLSSTDLTWLSISIHCDQYFRCKSSTTWIPVSWYWKLQTNSVKMAFDREVFNDYISQAPLFTYNLAIQTPAFNSIPVGVRALMMDCTPQINMDVLFTFPWPNNISSILPKEAPVTTQLELTLNVSPGNLYQKVCS